MSLDKAIEHGKERRNPVISPDSWCRNNGGCHYCESDRLHKYIKREITADEKMKEAETEMYSEAKSAQAKMKNIYTERLVLREMTEDDFRVYLNHLTEADEVFVQYGIEPTEELLNEISMFPDMLYYSIIEKASGDTVGYIEIHEESDNLAFYIFKEYRRRGYCSEALAVFAQAYLSGEMTGRAHDMIVAETLDQNIPCIKLLEKAGFCREAAGFRISLDEDDNWDAINSVNIIRYEYTEKCNDPE